MEPLVVYIIGDNRSGTTLLDYLLSCHPDAVSVGELHHLHDYYCKVGYGKRNNWECSCGLQIWECPFWKKILEEVSFSEAYDTKFRECRGNKLSYISKFFLNKHLENLTRNKRLEAVKQIADNIWKLYEVIFKVARKPIIIDSSKNALEAFFLNKFKKGSIKFLLLERDIGQVAYSKLSRMKTYSEEFQTYMSLKEKSIYENILSSYLVLRRNRSFANMLEEESRSPLLKSVNYLDLVKDPKQTIFEICTFLDIEPFMPPLATNSGSSEDHTLHGSPSRKEKKPIKPDERWKHYYKNKPLALLFAQFLQQIG